MKIILFLCLIVIFVNASSFKPIPYRDVKAIVLESGKYAIGQRSSVPQMKYVGSSMYSDYLPTTMLCSNQGWDGTQYTWECRAQFPNGLDLDRIEVACEDWNPPINDAQENDLMTAGSCGVEYSIRGNVPSVSYTPTTTTYYYETPKPNTFAVFFVIAFVVMVVVVGGCAISSNHSRTYVTQTPVIRTESPTIVVSDSYQQGSAYNSGYVDGIVTNSFWNRRSPVVVHHSPSPVVVHHSPTVVHHSPTVVHHSPTPTHSSTSTHSSSAFGGTKRR